MLQKQAIQLIGADVSNKNAKMPGTSYGISTDSCNVGAKLRQIQGSVCRLCNMCRIEKLRPSVKSGYDKRHASTLAIDKKWIDAMVMRIEAKGMHSAVDALYHRWNDSGDIHARYLDAIVRIARRMKDKRHWLPTKEYRLVRQYCKTHRLPKNLVVRVSAPMIDGAPPAFRHTSTVHKETAPIGHACPASWNGGSCDQYKCRACWDPKVRNVAYKLHR